MNEEPVRSEPSLLHTALWGGVSALAGVTAVTTALMLLVEYGQLSISSRILLAAITVLVGAGFTARHVRSRRPARLARVTVIHAAVDGEVFAPGSWDVHVGKSMPVHGLGVDVVTGRIISATVAADGRSVELTLELPPGGTLAP